MWKRETSTQRCTPPLDELAIRNGVTQGGNKRSKNRSSDLNRRHPRDRLSVTRGHRFICVALMTTVIGTHGTARDIGDVDTDHPWGIDVYDQVYLLRDKQPALEAQEHDSGPNGYHVPGLAYQTQKSGWKWSLRSCEPDLLINPWTMVTLCQNSILMLRTPQQADSSAALVEQVNCTDRMTSINSF